MTKEEFREILAQECEKEGLKQLAKDLRKPENLRRGTMAALAAMARVEEIIRQTYW